LAQGRTASVSNEARFAGSRGAALASLRSAPAGVEGIERAGPPGIPIEGSAEASIDDTLRFLPTTRPTQPEPQKPPAATPENVDTDRPVHEWQRATDDWLGVRPWLDDRGVSLQANLTLDFSKNLRGGLDTGGSATRHLFNANVTLDLERLAGLAGGTVFVNFQNQAGDNGSTLTRDIQAYSNIDADGRTQVSEFWYEQVLMGEKLRVRVGKIDANSEFAKVESAAAFLQSSMGVSPTITAMPKYPDAAFGIDLFLHPCDHWYVGAGVFDGAVQEGVKTGERGPATLFGPPADLYLIGETGVTWDFGGRRSGRLAAGVWHATGRLERFDGGTASGATGPYVVLEQVLWRPAPGDEADERGVAAFFQYGYADPSVSAFVHHVGGGVSWTGPIPGRADDVAGLGASWVRLTDGVGAGFGRDDELSVELFYKARVLKWLSVQPDVQYIRHPGGDRTVRDAWVATVRLVMDF
jgi:porin